MMVITTAPSRTVADPYPETPPSMPRVPLSSARAAVEDAILGDLGQAEPQTLLLNMTPGSGKSREAPSAVWKFLTERYESRNAAVLMLSPTRERTREWANVARGHGITAFEVHGRNESNCQRDDDCRAAANAGFEANVVCRTCRSPRGPDSAGTPSTSRSRRPGFASTSRPSTQPCMPAAPG